MPDWKRKPRRYFERLRRAAGKLIGSSSPEVTHLVEASVTVLQGRLKAVSDQLLLQLLMIYPFPSTERTARCHLSSTRTSFWHVTC